jgi:hypothetical protein
MKKAIAYMCWGLLAITMVIAGLDVAGYSFVRFASGWSQPAWDDFVSTVTGNPWMVAGVVAVLLCLCGLAIVGWRGIRRREPGRFPVA